MKIAVFWVTFFVAIVVAESSLLWSQRMAGSWRKMTQIKDTMFKHTPCFWWRHGTWQALNTSGPTLVSTLAPWHYHNFPSSLPQDFPLLVCLKLSLYSQGEVQIRTWSLLFFKAMSHCISFGSTQQCTLLLDFFINFAGCLPLASYLSCVTSNYDLTLSI